MEKSKKFELKKFVFLDDIPEIVFYSYKIYEKNTGKCLVTCVIDNEKWENEKEKNSPEIQKLLNDGNEWLKFYYDKIFSVRNNEKEFQKIHYQMCENADYFMMVFWSNAEKRSEMIEIPFEKMPKDKLKNIIKNTHLYSWIIDEKKEKHERIKKNCSV